MCISGTSCLIFIHFSLHFQLSWFLVFVRKQTQLLGAVFTFTCSFTLVGCHLCFCAPPPRLCCHISLSVCSASLALDPVPGSVVPNHVEANMAVNDRFPRLFEHPRMFLGGLKMDKALFIWLRKHQGKHGPSAHIHSSAKLCCQSRHRFTM